MFEIIAEFPDSSPAITELRDGFRRLGASGRHEFGLHDVGVSLRCILQRRLLHLGASTVQILDMYVTMIRALRELDPLDTLLNFVAVPLRIYLKQRPDTVRCIISSLIHDIVAAGGGSGVGGVAEGMDTGEGGVTIAGGDNGEGQDTVTVDLYNELKKGGKSLEFVADSDNEEAGPNDPPVQGQSRGKPWEPRKRDRSVQNRQYAAGLRSKSSYGMDIIALLVSIYGSMDVFVSEYRSLLAQRLLHTSPTQLHFLATGNLLAGVAAGTRFLHNSAAGTGNTTAAPLTSDLSLFDLDAEVANLELLKIRFGDDALNDCEIMLHDVADSKRVNTVVSSELVRVGCDSMGVAVGPSATADAGTVVDCVVVSDNYWPRMATADGDGDDNGGYGAPEPDEAASTALCINNSRKLAAHLHPSARALLDTYQRTYSVLKKPRRLIFLDDALGDLCHADDAAGSGAGTAGADEGPFVHMGSDLGFVELELCFDDNSVRTFTVTSVQASLVLYLSDLGEAGDDMDGGGCGVSLMQLCEAMQLSVDTHAGKMRQLMRFWVSQGVVSESRRTVFDTETGLEAHSQYYRVIEHQAEHARSLGWPGLPEWLNDLQMTYNRRGGTENEVCCLLCVSVCVSAFLFLISCILFSYSCRLPAVTALLLSRRRQWRRSSSWRNVKCTLRAYC